MNTFLRSFKVILKACPYYSIAMAIILLLSGFLPALSVYASSGIVQIIEGGIGSDALLFFATMWCLSILIPQILAPAMEYLQANINQLLTNQVSLMLIHGSQALHGIERYYDKDTLSKIETIKREAPFRPTNFAVNLALIIRSIATIASISVLLAQLIWWAPFVLLLAYIPLSVVNLRLTEYGWQSLMSVGDESRKTKYYSELSLEPSVQKELKLFNTYPLILTRYVEVFKVIRGKTQKARLKLFLYPIPVLIFATACIGSLLYILLNDISQVKASSLIVFVQSLLLVSSASTSLVEHGSMLKSVSLFFAQLFEFLDIDDKISDGTETLNEIQTLEFRNVSFCYPNEKSYALKNISFTIENKSSLAIVGANGAGKTTLTNLILRMYDVNEGSILINGKDLRAYRIDSLRARISSVFQDFTKFNFTLAENVSQKTSYGNVTKSLVNAGLNDQLVEQNVNTILGKQFGGIELSGGQWQKVAIARAIYKPSDLLILDEPTSAIDPIAEADLYKQFSRLIHGKISIMVTHRLGSVNNADYVLVLDKGEAVQYGKLTDLKNQDGWFRAMWDTQKSMYS